LMAARAGHLRTLRRSSAAKMKRQDPCGRLGFMTFVFFGDA